MYGIVHQDGREQKFLFPTTRMRCTVHFLFQPNNHQIKHQLKINFGCF